MRRYPADWKQRRERILARAKNRCERCGVANHAVGDRDDEGRFRYDSPYGENGKMLTAQQIKDRGLFRVVLTIAHSVEDGPLDCPDSDLQALCQKCHNALDAPMRSRHRQEKARSARAVGSLFDDD